MTERHFSVSLNPTAALSRSTSPLPPPQRTSLANRRPYLFRSASMRIESVKTERRKVSLEIEISKSSSANGSPGRPIPLRKTSLGATFGALLRARTVSSDASSAPPDLSCGESTQSDDSAPSTPRTALSDASCPSLSVDPEEEERKERERQEFYERQEILRDRSQFEFRRQFIPHHPFARDEVPYMQSYSHVALHNDYFLYDLLHYLTPPGSPTFHNFGNKPPRDVLDLGCGEGYWAAEAATVWKGAGTVITAFDIVDLGRPLRKTLEPEVLKRIIWTKGNFLKNNLPFPAKSFDFVRMANLALAIPHDRWKHLLEEVKRVLRPGGVLEIVDDQLFFPGIQPLHAAAPTRTRSLREPRKPPSEVQEDDKAQEKGVWKPLPDIPPLLRGESMRQLRGGSAFSGPVADFHLKSMATRGMETIFQNMLHAAYGIRSDLRELLDPILSEVFGQPAIVDTKEIAVPQRDLLAKKTKADDLTSPMPRGHETKSRKGRSSLDTFETDFTPPSTIAPKAKLLLEPHLQIQSRRPYQPSGFVVLPSTFVPCEPEALEMHACRNMHIVLACKDALATFLEQTQQAAPEGTPSVTEEEFEQMMFEYDSFRRQRLNWPQDYPGVEHEEEPLSPATAKPLFSRADLTGRFRPQSKEVHLKSLVREEDVIPVRCIRAFVTRR